MMTVSISGLTFEKVADGGTPNQPYARFDGTGTSYTMADFTIDANDGLGFTPKKVRAINLVDRVMMTQYVNTNLDGGSNAKGIKQVAAGTTTYEDTGIVVGTNSVTVTVATTLLSDNDDFTIECWG